jgi:murein DD-endopeptidase MepM/ murein hydrolase activator NlpD
MLVSPGMLVGKGAPLGTVGHAPNGDDPVHLHFELYKGSLSDYPRGTVDPDASLATSDWVTTTGGV